MKMSKRLTAALLSVLTLIILLPVQALAAGSIELSRDVSLTISYQNDKTSLVGAQFDIYLVATVDQYGELTPTETFGQFNVNIRGQNDEAWRTLASTLEGEVLLNQISPTDSGKTDAQGLVSFPNTREDLEHGLYLVLGYRHTQGGYRYDATPFMVLLPGLDKEANDWDYDVTANAKCDADKISSGSNTVTRKVLKVWEDDGHENSRPEEITVHLLRDGEIFKTVTLNAANDWRYTWTGLDDDYKWTVVEEKLEDYTVGITQEGVTFVVTNTYTEDAPGDSTPTEPPPPPTQPDNPAGSNGQPDTPTGSDLPAEPILPQTGQLWWPVPVLMAAGLLLIVLGVLRRRGARYEE